MLTEMSILNATIDYYLKLSKMNMDVPEVPPVVILVTEGVVGAYYYRAIVEVKYSRLYVIFNSKRIMTCLRCLECLVKQLKRYADWSYRAKLDHEEILNKETLPTIKRVEANLASLLEILKQPPHKGGQGN